MSIDSYRNNHHLHNTLKARSHLRDYRPRLSATVQILDSRPHAYGILTAVVVIRTDAYGILGQSRLFLARPRMFWNVQNIRTAVAAVNTFVGSLTAFLRHSYSVVLVPTNAYGIRSDSRYYIHVFMKPCDSNIHYQIDTFWFRCGYLLCWLVQYNTIRTLIMPDDNYYPY